MGREWYRVGGGGGSSSKSKRGGETTSSAACGGGSKSNARKETNSATVAGCMNAVFHLFHLHHFHFPVTNHRDSSSPSTSIDEDDASLPQHFSLPRGVEAPRNSFESSEEPPFSPIRRDDNLKISMGMQIKTKPTRSSKLESLTTTESSSPSTKTPTLVARLMGLDLLPDKSLNSPLSPTPSSCSSALSIDLGTPNLRPKPHRTRHKHYSLHRNSVDGGTRSLPETPRISLGRRSDADCYQQHRLSLHLNRDVNVSEHDHGHVRFASSRLKEMKTKDDKENRSPREYARQIVMQLKENVSRRMGTDITNTTRNKDQARDHHHELHNHHDSKKASKTITSDSSAPSCSPRLRFLDNPRTKPTSPKPPSPPSQTNVAQIVEDKPGIQIVQKEPRTEQGQEEQKQGREPRSLKSVKKGKKPENEMKFGSRLVKPPQTMQEEPFIRSPVGNRSSNSGSHFLHHQGDKKCKKTPLLNDLLNFTSVHTLLPVKKKDLSNLYVDALKVTETQAPRNRASEFPSCPSQTQIHIVRKDITTSTTSAAATTTTAAAELDYITRILRRTGIDNDIPISYAKWCSPSHPLDPSIFYFLEHFAITSARTKSSPGNMGLRCNRKLLFHLVDEILVDVLKPHMNMKPWVRHYPIRCRRNLRGSELIDELCRKIGRFPLADCQVLDDVDALVAGDLPETKAQRDLAFEEEGEGIVTELERQILETLVSETTSDYIMGTETSSFHRKVSVSRGRFT